MAIVSIDLKTGNVAQTEERIVGIDLGTSNSLVAVFRDGTPVALRNEAGSSSLLPSVVYFNPNGEIEVGEAAKLGFLSHPERTVYSVKRLMGKAMGDIAAKSGRFSYAISGGETEESLLKVQIDNKYYSAIELSAIILRHLKQRVEQQLGAAVSKTVITVPAYFNDAQRQATRDAGKLAGWDVLRIINEPTAASLAYGLNRNTEKLERIAVYDLGGGTFDLSILQIEDGVFEVLSTHGDTFLGGDDIDSGIVDYWLLQAGLDAELVLADLKMSQSLRLAAEKAKRVVGELGVFEDQLASMVLTLDTATLENIMQPLLKRTFEACALALQDAKLRVEDIDHLVLVGGATRSPFLRQEVKKYFAKEQLFDSLHPDEVVALGAAIQADILAGNQSDMLLLDITPLSLGIETLGGLMDVVLPRNSKIPTRVARNYTTSIDGQRHLKVSVYQGERDLVQDNRKLGAFELRNIPPMPAGIPKIEIRFMLDADGILTVRASELRSNTETEIEIKSAYGISEEEMGQMLLDSIQHAQQDSDARVLLEAQNEGRHVALSTEKFLTQNADWLKAQQVQQITDLKIVLLKAVAGTEKNAINNAMDMINTFTEPLAHEALDRVVLQTMKATRIDKF